MPAWRPALPAQPFKAVLTSVAGVSRPRLLTKGIHADAGVAAGAPGSRLSTSGR